LITLLKQQAKHLIIVSVGTRDSIINPWISIFVKTFLQLLS